MLRARSDCVTSWTSAASPGAGCDPLTSPPAILLAPVPEMETKGLSCSCDCVDRLKGKSVLTCVHTPRLCPPFVPARCRPCRQGWHGNSVRVRRRGLRQRSVQIVSLRPAAFFFSRRGRTAGRVESGSTGATPSSVDPLHPTRTAAPNLQLVDRSTDPTSIELSGGPCGKFDPRAGSLLASPKLRREGGPISGLSDDPDVIGFVGVTPQHRSSPAAARVESTDPIQPT